MTIRQGSLKLAERPKFLAQVRHSAIMEALSKEGSVTVTELAQQLVVSDMTIRRDLIELEKVGRLIRTHGGAVRIDNDQKPVADDHFDQEEPAFERRQSLNADLKRRIALLAVQIASNARSVAIDVGTTTYMLAELMTNGTHAKVFTNNIRASTLLAAKGIEVYLAGGRIREEEMSTSGPSAIAQFASLWFDVAFIGVSGLTPQGAFDYSFEEADMKRLYLTRSTRKIALCDSTKFDRMSLVNVGALADFNTLITDSEPPAELADSLEKAGVEILVAR
jgi:DeoR/GlpR family transcriptional regulator of sugar metabolism